MSGRMCGMYAVVCGVILLVSAARASGALITFSDRAAFEGSLVSLTKYTFEVADGFPLGPVEISSFGGGAVAVEYRSGTYVTPAELARQDTWPGEPQYLKNPGERGFLVLEFREPQDAVGFDVPGLTPWLPAFVTLVDKTGAPGPGIRFYSSGGEQDPKDPPPGTPFFGAISTEGISGAIIMLPSSDVGGWPNTDGIDNLTLGSVPEPHGSAVVALSALVALTRRRRSRLS